MRNALAATTTSLGRQITTLRERKNTKESWEDSTEAGIEDGATPSAHFVEIILVSSSFLVFIDELHTIHVFIV